MHGGMHLRDRMEEEEERAELLNEQGGQTAGSGLLAYLSKKDRRMRAANGASGEEASSDSAPLGSFDRLRGILDPDDKRVESLQREGIQAVSHGVAALSNNLGLSTDEFYAKTIQMYRDMRHQSYFGREAFMP